MRDISHRHMYVDTCINVVSVMVSLYKCYVSFAMIAVRLKARQTAVQELASCLERA